MQMSSPQRPGEITYYEELGVEDTASADEIRDAFRALARLLHPDQQTDPQLKEMAERQMRKLNRIHAVLSDANRRTAYDESLAAPRSAPIIVFSGSDGNLKKLLTRAATAFAILFGTFLLIWFMLTGNNNEVRGQEARGPSSSRQNDNTYSDAGEQISRLRDQLRVAEAERDSALEQLGRLGVKQNAASKTPLFKGVPAPSGELATATSMTELSSAAGPATTVDTIDATSGLVVKPAQFEGSWVYSRAAGSASPGGKSQYPPEFIEVTVTTQNGALHGQYRSRYQVLDHAISPDVNFDFTGVPVGSSLNCAWRGPGGARGRMTLKLLPSSVVEIAWNATELGTQQWLINGSATLTRK
jgi:curved DNA-binding protein CbpA